MIQCFLTTLTLAALTAGHGIRTTGEDPKACPAGQVRPTDQASNQKCHAFNKKEKDCETAAPDCEWTSFAIGGGGEKMCKPACILGAAASEGSGDDYCLKRQTVAEGLYKNDPCSTADAPKLEQCRRMKNLAASRAEGEKRSVNYQQWHSLLRQTTPAEHKLFAYQTPPLSTNLAEAIRRHRRRWRRWRRWRHNRQLEKKMTMRKDVKWYVTKINAQRQVQIPLERQLLPRVGQLRQNWQPLLDAVEFLGGRRAIYVALLKQE